MVRILFRIFLTADCCDSHLGHHQLYLQNPGIFIPKL